MNAHVLITGGAGFIGTRTAERLLREGARVRIIDNLHPQVHPTGEPPSRIAEAVEFVRGDVRDLEMMRRAVRGVSHIIHLAAETSVGQSMYASDVHIDVNARGTAVLFRAIREERQDVHRVVLASSRAIYGEGAFRCDRCDRETAGAARTIGDLEAGRWIPRCEVCGAPQRAVPTREDAPACFTSSYGMSKWFQERVARMEASQLGVRLIVLRYFNVYGAGQSPHNPYTGLITTLALRLRDGKPLVLYEEGTPVRDFVHVDDVAGANMRALAGELDRGATINIGTGEPVTLRVLATELAQAFGQDVAVQSSTRFRLGDIHASIADLARARDVLGYAPSVDLRTGLGRTVPELLLASADDRSELVEIELRNKGILRGG